MPTDSNDFNVVKERILAEFAAQGFVKKPLSFQKMMELREYAKARTDLQATNPTAEQVIWKELFNFLTERLSKASPESTMAKIDATEKERDDLQSLQAAMEAKLKARPHDFGVRAWWGFVIIGLLVGWMRSANLWSIALCGFAFCIAGMFFCIFALDSAEVQSKIAIFLHGLGQKRISNWLYTRALTIR